MGRIAEKYLVDTIEKLKREIEFQKRLIDERNTTINVLEHHIDRIESEHDFMAHLFENGEIYFRACVWNHEKDDYKRLADILGVETNQEENNEEA